MFTGLNKYNNIIMYDVYVYYFVHVRVHVPHILNLTVFILHVHFFFFSFFLINQIEIGANVTPLVVKKKTSLKVVSYNTVVVFDQR